MPDGIINPRNKSGGVKQTRPVSKGTQDYETNASLYPLTQPIPKLEAFAQVSGMCSCHWIIENVQNFIRMQLL